VHLLVVLSGLGLSLSLSLDLDGLAVLELLVEVLDGLGGIPADGLHNASRAATDLADGSVTGNLAETSPLTDHLALGNADESDLTGGAKSLDELDVSGLVAVLGKKAEDSITTVKSGNDLTETASKTVTSKSLTENSLDGSADVHLLDGSGGGGSDLLNGCSNLFGRHYDKAS